MHDYWNNPPDCGAQALDLRPLLEPLGIPLNCWWTEDGDIVGAEDRPLPFQLKLDWDDNLSDEHNMQAAAALVAAQFPDPANTYFHLKDFLDKRGYSTPHEFGRTLYKYTDCGPWTVFRRPGKDVYYEDKAARDTDWLDQCTGIGIGSIVEGSDVCVDPDDLAFPFTAEELERNIKNVNDVASFYWERDNTTYFTIWKQGATDPEVWCQWTQFEDAPVGDFPEDDAETLALAVKAGETLFAVGSPDYKTLIPIPDTDYFVREEPVPDYTY